MRKFYLLLTFTLLVAQIQAQDYIPLVVTSGFNHDVIAEQWPASTHTTISVDAASANHVLASINYAGATVGLPTNGLITSIQTATPGLTFQLADYTQNNSLRIKTSGETRVFSVQTPQKLKKLFILTTSGSSASTFEGSITFTDGTIQTFNSQLVPDWNDSGRPVAIQGMGRVIRIGTENPDNNSSNPKLFQIGIDISSNNQNKIIQQVSITKTSNGGILNIFAVSGELTDGFPTSVTFCDGATVADLVATVANLNWYSTATSGTALSATTTLTTGTYYAGTTYSNLDYTNPTVTDFATGLHWPYAITQLQNGTILVGENGSSGSGLVRKLDGLGTNLGVFSSGHNSVTGLLELANGDVLVSNGGNSKVDRISPDGTKTTFISGLNAPYGLLKLPSGDILVGTNGAIKKYTATGVFVSDFATISGENVQIIQASTGHIWVANFGNGLYRFNPDGTGRQQFVVSGATILAGVIELPNGKIWVSSNNGKIVQFDADGTNPVTIKTGLGNLRQMVLLANGRILVGDMNSSKIHAITPTTTTTNRVPVQVTVNSTPAPTAIAQAFCSATTVANLVATGTNLKWYNVATGGTALSSTTAVVTGTYYVSQTVTGCESDRTAVAVTVNTTSKPVVADKVFCYGATAAELSGTATNLKWYYSETGGTQIPNTDILQTGYYYASETANTCESVRTRVFVRVNYNIFSLYNEPVDVNGFSHDIVAQSVPENGVTTTRGFNYFGDYLISSSVFGATSYMPNNNEVISEYTGIKYKLQSYTQNNSFSLFYNETKTINFPVNVSNSNVIYLLASSSQNGTKFSMLDVTINFSDGSSQLFSNRIVYDWFYAGVPHAIKGLGRISGGTSLQNSTENPKLFDIILPLDSSNRNKTITSIKVDSKSEDKESINIMAVSRAFSDASMSATVCSNTTISSLKEFPSTLLWYDSLTATTPINRNSTFNNSGTYYVSMKVENCETDRYPITINLNTTPLPTAAAQNFCTSATVANLVATGTNLKWYNVATGGTELASTTAITTGTYYVSQTINGCESDRTAVAVTVNITPAPTTNYTVYLYTDATETLANIQVTGTDLKWYSTVTAGAAIANSTTLVSGTTYYVSQTLNNCESIRLAITVHKVADSPQTFCDGATVANLASNPYQGNAVSWYANATTTTNLAASTALASGTYYAQINITSTPITTATFATGMSSPYAITQLRSGKILVGESGGGQIYRYNADGTADGFFVNSGLMHINGIKELANGDILVSGNASNRVVRYTANGTLVGNFDANITTPTGIIELPTGEILIASYISNLIYKYNADGSNRTTFANALSGPLGLVYTSSGHIWVTNFGGQSITRFNADGTGRLNITTPYSSSSGIIELPNGKILVSFNGGQIVQFDADGTNPITIATNVGLSLRHMTLLADGRVLVAAMRSNAVYVLTPNNTLTTNRVPVTVNVVTLAITSTNTEVSCFGGNDGSATVTASGGTAPYSYLWNDTLGQSTATASNLVAGTYSVTVTDANGCTKVESVTITQSKALSLVTSQVDVLCHGANTGSATVTASGGTAPYSYLWNDTLGQSTATASNLVAGTYSVTVTDANGCTKVESVTITQSKALSLVTSQVDVLCHGANTGSATVAVSGGTAPYSYLWNDALGQTTATASNLVAGTYSVTVTDANGCSKVESVTITQSKALSLVTSQVDVLCHGANTGSATVAVSGGTAPYSYLWNDALGQTTATASNLVAGTYSVTVTDANGCTKVESVTITQSKALSLVTSQVDVLCHGANTGSATVAVSGGTAPYSYLWNDALGQTTATASNLVAGTYSVTVTDANGCSKVTSVTITEPIKVIVIANPNTEVLCSGDSTNINLSSTTPGTTYSWTVVQNRVSGAVAGSGNTISQMLTATTSQIGTVTYIITPTANGCVGESIEVVVTVNPIPVVVATPASEAFCSGNTTNIVLSSETLNTTYSWTVVQNGVSGAVAGSGNTISQTLTATTAQIGTVTYIITPTANSCVGEPIEVVVTVNPIPVVVATPNTEVLCSGSTTNLVLSSETLNTTYSWTVVQNGVSGAVAGSGNTISQMLTATTSQIGTVTYIITPTANGCVGESIEVVVTVNPIPVVVATPNTEVLCNGSTTNLVLSSETLNTTYSWTVVQNGVSGAVAGSGNTISQTLTATTAQIGTVTYIITPTANGCVGESIEVVVTVNLIPVVVATPANEAFCSGSTTNLVLSSETLNTTYSWTVVQNGVSGAVAGSGNTISQTLTATTSQIGTVTYIITPTANGCVGEPIEVVVTVNPIPVVVATPASEVFCSGSQTNIVLSSETLNTTYSWTVVQNGVSGAVAGSGSTISQMLTATTAQIGTVTYIITPTANGCVGESIEVVVTVNPIPVVVATPATLNLCSDDVSNIVLSSETLNTTYSWTVVQNGVSGAVAGSGSTISQTLTATTAQIGTVTYIITPTANGCVGESTEVTLFITPYVVPEFEPVTAICAGETLQALPTRSLNGIEGTWSPALNNMETTTYTFTPHVQNTGTVCQSQTSLTIVVHPIPVVQASVVDSALCSGETTSISLTSQVPGTQFSYTVVSSNVSGAEGGVGNAINQTLLNTTLQEGNVVYAITPIANNCQGDTIYVEVKVNPNPELHIAVSSLSICSNEELSASFSSNVPGTTYSWTVLASNVNGALSGSGDELTQTLTTTGLGGTVTYIVTPMFNGCSGIAQEFTVEVKPRPEVFAPSSLTICSGEYAQINLSASHPDVTYSYTVQQDNVVGGFSGTGSLIDQMLETLTEQVGYVTYYITPSLNGCEGETISVRVRVNPVKYIDLADGYICYDSKTGLAISNHTIQTGLSASQYSFVWYQDQEILAGEIGNSLTVNEAGIYHVVATNLNTGCVSESGFSVISESYSAESVQAFVSNSFTHGAITVVVTGSGNYQYQLNGGAFQSSNIFTNVLPGTHRIVVIDSEGCTHEELEVHILSFMNFFTPNGDGIHDTWNIWSLSDQADAEIYIFDRHGKLIKQISPSGEGWDGTYNGVAVPSTDYWFSVTYRDGIHQEIKTYKSHFSLKR